LEDIFLENEKYMRLKVTYSSVFVAFNDE